MADLPDFGTPESSGTFTVSVEDAARKLGQHQLADPGLGVLKLVQAAVGTGAQNISIVQAWSYTAVECGSVGPGWHQDPDFLIGYRTLLERYKKVEVRRTSVVVPAKVQLERWRLGRDITYKGSESVDDWPVGPYWESHEEGFSIYLTPGQTEVYPRRRGILLDAVPYDAPRGLTVVFPADDLPVDLGQFALVQGPEWRERQQALGPRLREAIDRASQDPETLDALSQATSALYPGTLILGGIGMLCFGFPLPGGLMALCGVVAIPKSWRYHYRRRELRAEQSRRLREPWGLPPL